MQELQQNSHFELKYQDSLESQQQEQQRQREQKREEQKATKCKQAQNSQNKIIKEQKQQDINKVTDKRVENKSNVCYLFIFFVLVVVLLIGVTYYILQPTRNTFSVDKSVNNQSLSNISRSPTTISVIESNNRIDIQTNNNNSSEIIAIQKINLSHTNTTNKIETSSQIKIQDQAARNTLIDKYYQDGLREYYQNIRDQIHVVRVQISTKPANFNVNNYTQNFSKLAEISAIVINAADYPLQKEKSQGKQALLQLLVNKISGLGQNMTILVLTKNISLIPQLPKTQTQTILITQSRHIHAMDSTYGFINQYIQRGRGWVLYVGWERVLDAVGIVGGGVGGLGDSVLVYMYGSVNISYSNIRQYIINTPPYHLNTHPILFQPHLLHTITPTNFAYQNIYTLADLLTRPLVSLAHMADRLSFGGLSNREGGAGSAGGVNGSMSWQTGGDAVQRWRLRRLVGGMGREVCFVGLPVNSYVYNWTQLIQYLQVFQNWLSSTPTIPNPPPKLILPIIYHPEPHPQTQSTLKKILTLQPNLPILLKLRQHNISSSLQTYQISRSYCYSQPDSVMVLSRFNVVLDLGAVLMSVGRGGLCGGSVGGSGKCVVIGGYVGERGGVVRLGPVVGVTSQPKLRANNVRYFQTHMRHVQIFCSSLAREMMIQKYKWQELIFYETEAAYAVPILQRARNNIYQDENILYTVKTPRNPTQTQVLQTSRLPSRDISKPLQESPLKPTPHDELNNHRYSRSPTPKIPKTIHQIWLSTKPTISPVRQATIDSIKSTHPQFRYVLWKLGDVTRGNFPITYDAIRRIQEVQRQEGRNFRALVADLMRIQILYKQGGFYLDLKVQVKKSLEPFLYYQQFYFLVTDQYLVNGVIGSAPGNRHYKTILRDFFRPQLMKVPKPQIFSLTGGGKLIQAYSQKQIYTQVYNIHQFIYEGERPCVFGMANNKKPEQQKFEGLMAFPGTKRPYKILIPCYLDQDKYMQLYDIIGRTYIPGNQQFY